MDSRLLGNDGQYATLLDCLASARNDEVILIIEKSHKTVVKAPSDGSLMKNCCWLKVRLWGRRYFCNNERVARQDAEQVHAGHGRPVRAHPESYKEMEEIRPRKARSRWGGQRREDAVLPGA